MEQIEDEHGNLTTVYTTANIEDIQVGDLVYSYDTATGEVVQSEVTSTLHRNSDHLRYIEVVDENGVVQIFETTDAHPFWVDNVDADDGRVVPEYVEEYDPVTGETIIIVHNNTDGNAFGGYICAGDLLIGDVCIGPNGEHLTVISTVRENFPNGIAVYNFEVAGTSCYYVIANADASADNASPLLVHNMCAKPKKTISGGNLEKLKPKDLKNIKEHEFKAEVLGGPEDISKFNISMNKDTKEIFLTPVKKGAGPNIPTDYKLGPDGPELIKPFL